MTDYDSVALWAEATKMCPWSLKFESEILTFSQEMHMRVKQANPNQVRDIVYFNDEYWIPKFYNIQWIH